MNSAIMSSLPSLLIPPQKVIRPDHSAIPILNKLIRSTHGAPSRCGCLCRWAAYRCERRRSSCAPGTRQGCGYWRDVRGYYDLTGYRADGDLMAWFIADTPEPLQAAYRALALSNLDLTPVWSVIAQHKPAEFNKSHLPGMFLQDKAPTYAAVYPFVRSYDWYLLEPWKRAAIMKNHGLAGKGFGDLVTSTLETFSLSDYEWVVSLEGNDINRLVDLMYAFRNTEAHMHVRQDTPYLSQFLQL